MAVQQSRIVNDGKTSEEQFEKNVAACGYAVFRLRDKRDLHGLNKRSVAAFGQPSDYIIVTKTGALLAEVKSSHETISFPFSCFTRAQRAAMAQCVACNVGEYYVVYVHNLNTDKWFCVNAKKIITTMREGRKSLRWDELKPLGEI